MLSARIEGEKALRRAIRRHPRKVKKAGLRLFGNLKKAYLRRITRNPWKIGDMGGGVPRDTNRLADSHNYRVSPTRLKIDVNKSVADRYGYYVHEGTNKMDKRPWLDYAHEKERATRKKEIGKFLDKIISNLAK